MASNGCPSPTEHTSRTLSQSCKLLQFKVLLVIIKMKFFMHFPHSQSLSHSSLYLYLSLPLFLFLSVFLCFCHLPSSFVAWRVVACGGIPGVWWHPWRVVASLAFGGIWRAVASLDLNSLKDK